LLPLRHIQRQIKKNGKPKSKSPTSPIPQGFAPVAADLPVTKEHPEALAERAWQDMGHKAPDLHQELAEWLLPSETNVGVPHSEKLKRVPMMKLLENSPHLLKVVHAAYRIFQKNGLESGTS
jgi:hypothetical protein